MGKKTLLLIFALLTLKCIAQESETDYVMDGHEQELLKNAKLNFDKGKYSKALPLYLKLDKNYPDVIEYKYFAGICYLYKADEQEKAIDYLEEVYNKKRNLPDLDFYLGKAYFLNYHFKEAIGYFKLASENKKTSNENREKIGRLLENCENGKILIANYVEEKLTIENLGAPVNTEYSEYAPLISSDESVMIFTYKGKKSKGGLQNIYGEPDPKGEYFEDIFISYRLGKKWLEPEDLGFRINTGGHDASIALSHDGQKLFVYKNLKGGDIYVSNLERSIWSAPVKLEKEVNSKYQEGSASISSNGKTLYFSSDRPGGYGGKDIYRATLLDDGTWGNVENMGEVLNTPYNEYAPFIHANGNLLYFSSEGHNSMGGYDIFHSTFEDSIWSEPENIGHPVNTPNNDLFYVVSASGERGYFSSGRKGGLGGQDIYVVKPGVFGKKPVLALIKGIIKNNGRNVQAIIKVLNVTTDELYGIFKSNAATGNYILVLPPGFDYKIDFELQGKLKHTENVDVKGLFSYIEVEQDFELSAGMNPAIGATDLIQTKINKILGESGTRSEETGSEEVPLIEGPTVDTVITGSDTLIFIPVIFPDANLLKKLPDTAAEETLKDSVEEQYNAAITNADNYFDAKDYLNAKSSYQEALAIKPVEQYPKDKINEIDEILHVIKAEELTAEELVKEEQYNTAITNSDNYFDAKDYPNAKSSYQEALAIKPAEQYPRDKINEIDEILHVIKAEELAAEELAKKDTIVDKLPLEEKVIVQEEVIKEFENILFDFDKSTLRPKSKQALNKIYEYLNENKNAELEIAGHADSIGTDEYNMNLSDRRARAAGSFLMNRGVNYNQLNLFSFGESRSIAPNSNPDGSDNPRGRQLNRRVEFSTTKGAFSKMARIEIHPTRLPDLPRKQAGGQATPKPIKRIATAKGIIYKVQVAAYRHPENYNNDHLADLGQLEQLNIGEITRFTLGQFETLDKAKQFKKIVVKRGTKDAFITAEVNGIRRYLFELSPLGEIASRIK